MAMELQVRRDGAIRIIATTGYIDSSGGQAIMAEVAKLIAEGANRVVVNLAGSRLINSAAVMCLFEAADAVAAAGGGVYLSGLNDIMLKTMRIMGVSTVATICATEAEAVDAASGASGQG